MVSIKSVLVAAIAVQSVVGVAIPPQVNNNPQVFEVKYIADEPQGQSISAAKEAIAENFEAIKEKRTFWPVSVCGSNNYGNSWWKRTVKRTFSPIFCPCAGNNNNNGNGNGNANGNANGGYPGYGGYGGWFKRTFGWGGDSQVCESNSQINVYPQGGYPAGYPAGYPYANGGSPVQGQAPVTTIQLS